MVLPKSYLKDKSGGAGPLVAERKDSMTNPARRATVNHETQPRRLRARAKPQLKGGRMCIPSRICRDTLQETATP